MRVGQHGVVPAVADGRPHREHRQPAERDAGNQLPAAAGVPAEPLGGQQGGRARKLHEQQRQEAADVARHPVGRVAVDGDRRDQGRQGGDGRPLEQLVEQQLPAGERAGEQKVDLAAGERDRLLAGGRERGQQGDAEQDQRHDEPHVLRRGRPAHLGRQDGRQQPQEDHADADGEEDRPARRPRLAEPAAEHAAELEPHELAEGGGDHACGPLGGSSTYDGHHGRTDILVCHSGRQKPFRHRPDSSARPPGRTGRRRTQGRVGVLAAGQRPARLPPSRAGSHTRRRAGR
ncbi:MAG: hypothetical protein AVDCRST_MAG64-3178 [uncultured Phycisphaerae bacterium]|uniref:Uncharacterized protein n=1 Tax=uncultured Phycisphaerae bacterium TaxID=904963 RepID=A0A6J4PW93_9BACT|nr:MAG: hypothetical protein AVDCRST_MAG64-3178 [uncultured Phycisphaerae bacterium]